jgi:hypothetical protein
MARKRKKLKDLDYGSIAYWEALLKQEHLSMERGRSTKLSYVGTTKDLEVVTKLSHERHITEDRQN